MLCYLPIFYPDELLYSVIARYLIRIGTKSAYSASEHIFGRKTKAQIDLPSSLKTLSERTRTIWAMSGEEIVNKLTLFPYYSRYVPCERAEKCLQALLNGNGNGIHYLLGVSSQRVKVPRVLRFCKTCRESDLSRYGETYWCRSHQLAGVLVCPEHGNQLINTKVLLRKGWNSNYADATMSTSDSVLPDDDISLSELEVAIALKIAQRCKEMLLGPIELWNAENTSMAYRQAAIECGFVEGAVSLSQPELESAFISFYGESLLSKLGCVVLPGKGSSWLRNIFRGYRRTFHPLEHALVQIFLENSPVESSKKIPFGHGPWKCPNPYVKHKEQFPITKPNIYIGRNGSLVASAKCSCGFNFTFLRTSDTDPHLPIVNKICVFGSAWEAEAEKLKRSGLGTRAIAKKMRIDRGTARHLLNKKSGAYHVSQEQIKGWRMEWTKLLDGVSNRSRSLARKKDEALYKKLRRNDRNWLYKKPRSRNLRYPRERRVDWAGRDEKWSGILRSSAQKVRDVIPVKRLSRSAIVAEAGLKSTIFSNLDRLPSCSLVLNECSESLEDYRERRLRAARVKALKTGMPLKPFVLKRLASLEGKLFSSRLNAVLQELVSP